MSELARRNRQANAIDASQRDVARLAVWASPGTPPASIRWIKIRLTAHGFSVGDIVQWNGTAWSLALNDNASDGFWTGIISAVPGPNNFQITFAGIIQSIALEDLVLTPGLFYYLSSSDDGFAVNPVDPEGFYNAPVFYCIATDTILVFPCNAGSPVAGNAILDTSISQTAHGFAVGTVVYWNGTVFAKARANAAATCLYAGVVSKVEDVNHFDLTYAGVVTGLSGLTPGTVYYLSDATAGAVLAAAPASTAYQVPVFVAETASKIIVYSCSGVASSPKNIHAGDASAGGGLLRIYSTNSIYVDIDGAGNLTITNGTLTTVITDASLGISNGAIAATLTNALLTLTDGTHTTTLSDVHLQIANGAVSTTLNDASLTITDGTNTLSAGDLAVEVNNGTANSTMEATQLDIVNGSGLSSLMDDAGNLTLTQANGNVIQLKTADMASVTSQTAKMLAYQVCDTSTGTIKTALILSTPPT